MTDLDMWSALIGVFLPALVSVITRVTWAGWVKGVVVAAASAIAGGGTAALTGQLTGRGVVSSVLVVAVAALGTYRIFWHPTGIADKIEAGINPGPPAPWC